MLATTSPVSVMGVRATTGAASAKLADPEKHLTAGVLAPPAVGHTVIDATSSADRQLAQALAALKSPGPVGG